MYGTNGEENRLSPALIGSVREAVILMVYRPFQSFMT